MAAVSITDASGKVLKTMQLRIEGTKPIEIITGQWPAGAYWLTLRLNGLGHQAVCEAEISAIQANGKLEQYPRFVDDLQLRQQRKILISR